MMKLSLIEQKPVQPGVITFLFMPEEPVDWEPGQYMHYVFPHKNEDDRGNERWFTISAAPFEVHLAITTRISDKEGSSFKKALLQLKPGDTVEADGPKGKFILEDANKRHVLIAGGIGITPYRAMLAQMDHDNEPINVELLYANRDDQLIFGDELNAIADKHQNFDIKPYIGDARITPDELQAYMDKNTLFYISGPKPMVETYQHTLADIGVPEDQVKTDYFPGYQMG
jgi:ferredoxin-NADP reductase